MPYVSFMVDSSESIITSEFDLEVDIVQSYLDKMKGVSVLDAGFGHKANKSIATHISAFVIVDLDEEPFDIGSTDYQYVSEYPGFFDPSIFDGQPSEQAFFSNNTTLDDLSNTIGSWGRPSGLSVNLAGFVWGVQTVYNTQPSATHPQALGMYNDVKAAMAVVFADGYDNAPNEGGLTQAFEQNDTCSMVAQTLQGKGLKFEPYWVTINGTKSNVMVPLCDMFNHADEY